MNDGLPWTLQLASTLTAGGLDVVHPFAFVDRELRCEASIRDNGLSAPLAVLIGNTRALWPAFRAALAADDQLAQIPNPLDHHVTRLVTDAATATGVPHQLRFAHHTNPAVPIQRIAQSAGLAWLSPSHLSVHPQFGPWIGFRALLVFEAPGPAAAIPPPDLCGPCTRPCMPALAQALDSSRPRSDGQPDVIASWRMWLAVRDACPVGTEHRYSDDQIRYHYSRDARALKPAHESADASGACAGTNTDTNTAHAGPNAGVNAGTGQG